MERLVGSFYSWNERGHALIFVAPQRRYFMHISDFKSDHLPVVGEKISFDVAPTQKPGQLPCAVNVCPIQPTSIETSSTEVA